MNLYESVRNSLKESEYDDNVVVMECNRIGYGPDQVMDDSLTVGELIDTLNEYDSNMKIVTSHDRGYTYGPIHYEDFSEEEVERDDEDEEEEEIDESCKGKEIKESEKGSVDKELREFIQELVHNHNINITKNIEDRIEIAYVISRLANIIGDDVQIDANGDPIEW